jgi:hypothetical protein
MLLGMNPPTIRTAFQDTERVMNSVHWVQRHAAPLIFFRSVFTRIDGHYVLPERVLIAILNRRQAIAYQISTLNPGRVEQN